MKILLFFALFTFNTSASTSQLLIKGTIPPRYTVTVDLENKVKINSNTVNNDSFRVFVRKKGKLLNCHIIQQ